jgi:formamidopyrimidine-DNA glycosylase
MPELPDVETLKRYLDATALKQEIARTSIRDRRIVKDTTPQRIYSRLKGSQLLASHRRGKFLFCALSGDNGSLVLHFGMTGDLKYYDDPSEAPEHACMILDFTNGRHLGYVNYRMLGRVSWTDNVEDYVSQQDLGIDALSDELTLRRFRELLAGRTGRIKSTLMNQSIVAGIGNVYSDEILFQAGVHPKSGVDALSDKNVKALFRAMKRVLKTAIKKRAVTSRLPASYILPGRGEEEFDCPRCGARIQTVDVGGRTAYVCPNCQKQP